jgi:AraC-like DNA-binding protein
MQYLRHVPRPPLARFVDFLWLYQGDAQPHAMERVLPSATTEFIIDLGDDGLRLRDRRDPSKTARFAGALVVGPQAEFFVIDTSRPRAIMGVHFKPGGAFAFFRLPMDELVNAHVPLDALWGGKVEELRDRLLEADGPAQKFLSLERSLLAALARPDARHGAVAAALTQFRRAAPVPKIADFAEAVGLSQRRFIEIFSAEVGPTPKLFCRVLRFQQVLRLVNDAERVDWTEIALTCGYYDQPHFIHDFQAFCGFSPSAYLVHRAEHMNHARHS